MATIVSRREWGAPATPGGSFLPVERVDRLFVHYTGSASDFQADHANCARRVLGIYRYHTSPTPDDPTKPWADIAYSWVVCIHGVIFEGRGWNRRTAATGPCNDDSHAICLLGNDREGRRDVTPAARAAFAWLIAEYERRGGRMALRGHRDCMSTACPGDELYALIRSGAIRRLEEDLPLTNEDVEKVVQAVWGHGIAAGGGFPEPWSSAKHLRTQSVQLRQLLDRGAVDEQAIAAAVLAGLKPAELADAIAAALGPDMAGKVAAELARRLAA